MRHKAGVLGRWSRVCSAAVVVASVGILLPAVSASADDPTISYNTLRTGWDTNEPGLSPSEVSSSDFGQLFSTAVDGQVYGQPITAGGTLVVATENDKVYGLDPATGSVHWTRDLGNPWPASTTGCGDLTPNIGVTSTPVYDPSTGTVYLVAKVNDGPDPAHPHWYVHAVDAATGAERPGWPVAIQGAPDNDPAHPFLPETEFNRAGLLLMGGVVYAGFASNCDYEPYVGDVVGVNAATGARTAMWSDEAGSSTNEAGIWQSGGGLISDGPGRIILATGNGISPPPGPGDSPPATLAESVVRLQVNGDGTLSPQSFFSPTNNANLDREDADLGAGGPMELPQPFGTPAHPHLVMQVGKDGRVFLLDADHLGGTGQGAGGGDAALSVNGPFNGVWGHPAFWGGDGGYAYTVENQGYLRAYKYTVSGSGLPSLSPTGTSAGTLGYTSGSPVVTSDGTTSGSALVWVVYASGSTGTGAQLRAYAPVPQNGVLPLVYEAPIGTASKFSVPGVDGGRVFVGTRDGHVLGFGHPTTAPLQSGSTNFGPVSVGASANATATVTATRQVTVSAVSTSSPFADSPPALPVTLAAGQTLSVPVAFSPSTWGSASGQLAFTTDQGEVDADLQGTGTSPGLGAAPSSLSFTEVPTGSQQDQSVDVVNTSTTAETITGVSPPAPPFTATGLPAIGTAIPAQGSVSMSIAYAPTSAGTDNGTLMLDSNAGGVSVPLAGTSVAGAAHLSIQPNPLSFGSVPVGESSTQSFDISNSGNIPLTITKAAPPTGAFTVSSPISEGQQLAPGQVFHQSVTFTPTAAGQAAAQYLITGNDGQGSQNEQLVATATSDPVAAYYQRLGGTNSSLGKPIDSVYSVAGGEAQDFLGGSIFWSPATGAHAVRGAILARYQALGGPTSFLGFPTIDDTQVSDGIGWYTTFAGPGAIFWSGGTGAWSVHGAIYARYQALGGATGILGYPTSDETGVADGAGRYNTFSLGGAIYWTLQTGAWSVHGAILAHYRALGGPTGILGYPTSDETGVADGAGRYNTFSVGGAIYWHPWTGPWSVHGAIYARYLALGGPTGILGYPLTDENGTPDGTGRFNHFTGSGGASIYWTPRTGAWSVHGAIRAYWAAAGWERSRFGYPVSDEYAIPAGRASNFASGTISWSAVTGAIWATPG